MKEETKRPVGRPPTGITRTRTSVSLPTALLEGAREHGINISAAAATGVESALRKERANPTN